MFLLAESSETLFQWNPTTFYVACGVIHTVVIWIGMQLFGADPEYNTIPAAIAAAAVGNVAAYFLRDFGVVGFISTAGVFVLLLLISSGIDIFRTVIVFILVMGSYAAVGKYVVGQTEMTAYDLGGVPKVTMKGLKAEPLERPDAKKPGDIDDGTVNH